MECCSVHQSSLVFSAQVVPVLVALLRPVLVALLLPVLVSLLPVLLGLLLPVLLGLLLPVPGLFVAFQSMLKDPHQTVKQHWG